MAFFQYLISLNQGLRKSGVYPLKGARKGVGRRLKSEGTSEPLFPSAFSLQAIHLAFHNRKEIYRQCRRMSNQMPQQLETSTKRYQCAFFFIATVLVMLSLVACSSKYTVKSPEYAGWEGEINQHVRLVKAPPNQVFQILTAEKAFGEICPKGTVVTHESPLPFREGSLVKTKIDNLFDLEWNSRVEEIIDDHRIRLKFLEGFFSGGIEIWELEEVDQYSRVTHTIIFQPDAVMKKMVWLMKVRTKHDEMVEVFLDNLNAAVSSSEMHAFQPLNMITTSSVSK